MSVRKCLDCGHKNTIRASDIHNDDLGTHTICKKCKGSFDIEIWLAFKREYDVYETLTDFLIDWEQEADYRPNDLEVIEWCRDYYCDFYNERGHITYDNYIQFYKELNKFYLKETN